MPSCVQFLIHIASVCCTGRIGDSGDGMLFMSQDAGLNWTTVSCILYFQSSFSTFACCYEMNGVTQHMDKSIHLSVM